MHIIRDIGVRPAYWISLFAAALLLAGCGGGSAKFKLSPEQLGEETAGQIKRLPRGLIGDEANESHSYETLRGDSAGG